MTKSIILAGGGTAGHVNPLLAVAQEIRSRYPEAKVTVLGTAEGLEADLVPARGFELSVIPRVPMPRKPTPAWFALPSKLQSAIKASKDAITAIDADVVIGFGGYVSTPAYIAAHRLGVPIVVQEQNARAGIANKIGARWASVVTTSFASTSLGDAHVTGLPLRAEISSLIERRSAAALEVRQEAAHELGLDPLRPILVVTGGSLGALRLNQTMAASAREILNMGVQVLHLTGRGKSEAVNADVNQLSPELRADYHVMEYLERMDLAYAVADLVVCRSGAGTVCEIAALGIPAVFVPLPIGNGEQRLNAADVVAASGALIVDDSHFTPQWVEGNVLPLLAHRERLVEMAQAASTVGKPFATKAVVDIVEKVAGWVND